MNLEMLPRFTLLSLLVAGLVYFMFLRPGSEAKPSPPGYDDLIPCSFVTSYDSKMSLELNQDQTARLTDKTMSEDGINSYGKWELADPKRHVYAIHISKNPGYYMVINPPDAEGCMLAAGTEPANVNIWRSWFSAIVEAPESDRSSP